MLMGSELGAARMRGGSGGGIYTGANAKAALRRKDLLPGGMATTATDSIKATGSTGRLYQTLRALCLHKVEYASRRVSQPRRIARRVDRDRM